MKQQFDQAAAVHHFGALGQYEQAERARLHSLGQLAEHLSGAAPKSAEAPSPGVKPSVPGLLIESGPR